MDKEDGRKLSRQAQYERRKQAVRLHKRGMKVDDIAAALSMGHVTVLSAIKAAHQGGAKALAPKPTARPVGCQRRLSPEQELHIQRPICKHRPEQLKLEFALCSRAAVMLLLKQEFGIDFLSDGLMADPTAVEIGGNVYLPLALPQRLEELLGIVVQMAAEIADPFEQAFFLMVHLPYLQPFEDVNKRVSRLAANIPLIRHNLCPLSFIDVPQQAYVNAMLGVYELNRVELLRDVFVWAYERSCQQYVAIQQTLVPPDIFRLRHRQALAEVIAAIVRQGEAVTEQAVKGKIPASVPPAEHAHFTTLVLAEFAALHAGNAVRFGIRPLEFSEWQGR